MYSPSIPAEVLLLGTKRNYLTLWKLRIMNNVKVKSTYATNEIVASGIVAAFTPSCSLK